MGDPAAPSADTNVNANGNTNGYSAHDIYEKYAQERAKRLRADGLAQYVPLRASSSSSDAANNLFRRFAADPWAAELVDAQRANKVRTSLPDGYRTRILIVGAGNGGLYFAVRLLQAGFSVDDLLIVDTAGGFGGTWYWNRYPGLMCDVESYIYMPLLEEMGYMPRHKYAYGEELRGYVNEIAERWGLHRAALFQTRVTGLTWDEQTASWTVDMEQEQLVDQGLDDRSKIPLSVHSDFVILATGILNVPKMPGIPGIDRFQGHSFHTSRWDYGYTGGSPQDPRLTNLQDKKVGIVGTGATAVQAVPQLAKWAKELYVFQRTPSAVDVRDNRETDADWWAQSVTARGKKGWQRERMENYNAFISHVKDRPATDMVADAWTSIGSYCVLVGGPDNQDEGFVERAKTLDIPRQERIRNRVEQIVHHQDTAQSLKAWYASWCKRPCFHDEYLQTFNEAHVRLVDTDGRGISRLTDRGPVVATTNEEGKQEEGEEYGLDLLVFSTGFAVIPGDTPASRGGLRVTGRDGIDMDTSWTEQGVGTLHGVVGRGFPNLFFPGRNQAAAGPNHSYTLDVLSTHISFIISQATSTASISASQSGGECTKNNRAKVTVEPTVEAQQAWGDEIARRATSMAGLSSCTPSYMTGEGTRGKPGAAPEELLKAARMGSWGKGINDYVRVIEEWRARGGMEGLEVVLKDGD